MFFINSRVASRTIQTVTSKKKERKKKGCFIIEVDQSTYSKSL